MEIFDKKFKENKARYIVQCLLAVVSVLTVLLVLGAFSNAAIIAALGASSFIVFTMPKANVSRPRFLVGGYFVGIASGSLCNYLSELPVLLQFPFIQDYSYVVFGATAVGLAIFVMVITDTEHPPAASVALGLVLDEWSLITVAVIFSGIVALSVIKALLKPILINLL